DRAVALRPDRDAIRHDGAVAAARLGMPSAEARLGPLEPWDRGSHTVTRARIALARGDRERAVSLLTESVDQGVDNLPWMHATDQCYLVELGSAMGSVPRGLRVDSR